MGNIGDGQGVGVACLVALHAEGNPPGSSRKQILARAPGSTGREEGGGETNKYKAIKCNKMHDLAKWNAEVL